MAAFRTTVHGSDAFYANSAFRSMFFVVDTLLLLFATAITAFVLWKYWPAFAMGSIVRFFGVLLGMWIMWWKAQQSHREINHLYRSGTIGGKEPETALRDVIRVSATMTHTGMFLFYLVVCMLLMNLDYILHQTR